MLQGGISQGSRSVSTLVTVDSSRVAGLDFRAARALGHWCDGLQQSEIAAKMGLSRNQVAGILNRLRKRRLLPDRVAKNAAVLADQRRAKINAHWTPERREAHVPIAQANGRRRGKAKVEGQLPAQAMAPRRASNPVPASALPAASTAPVLPVVPAGSPRPRTARALPRFVTDVAPPVPSLPAGPKIPCCWPIGEPRTKSFRYCEDPSEPGRPYCADHAKDAYVRVSCERERRAA